MSSKSINRLSEIEQMRIIQYEPEHIDDIINPSEKLQLCAVERDGMAIQFIAYPTEKVKEVAIKNQPGAIGCIDDPSTDLQFIAFKSDIWLILRVSVPQLDKNAIIPLKSSIIKSILSVIANKQDTFSTNRVIHIINNMKSAGIDWNELDTIQKSMQSDRLEEIRIGWDNAKEEELIARVSKNPEDIAYIKNPSEAAQLIAVMKDPYTIADIKSPTYAVMIKAIKLQPDTLQWIAGDGHPRSKEAIEECKQEIINSIIKAMIDDPVNGPVKWPKMAFRCLELEGITWPELGTIKHSIESDRLEESREDREAMQNASPEDLIRLIGENPENIDYIRDPSEELQLKAVTLMPSAIKGITNPTQAVQNRAFKKDPSAIIACFEYGNEISNISIENCKDSIIKYMLESLSAGENISEIKDLIFNINNYHDIDWPELDMIREVLDEEYNDDELDETVKSSYGKDYNKADEKTQIRMVKNGVTGIGYIRNPSETVQIAAVSVIPQALEYIKKPTDKVKLLAVTLDPHVIQFIKRPSAEILIAALNADPNIIWHSSLKLRFNNQIINACKDAFIKNILGDMQNGDSDLAVDTIEFLERYKIKWPELSMIRTSLKNDGMISEAYNDKGQNDKAKNKIEKDKNRIIKNFLSALKNDDQYPLIRYNIKVIRDYGLNWPELDMIEKTMDHDSVNEVKDVSRMFDTDQKDLIAAIKKNVNAIKRAKVVGEEAQMVAINKDPSYIKYIKNPTEAVQLAVVKQYPRYVEYIKNPTEEVQLYLVHRNVEYFHHIKKPTEAVNLYVVSMSPRWIRFMKDPSEEVQMTAIDADSTSVCYISNLSKNIVEKRKHEILKRILINLSDNHMSIVLAMIKKLNEININWPELEIIENSLRSDGKINESRDYWNDPVNEEHLLELYNEWKKISIWRAISHLSQYGIRDIAVHKELFKDLEKYKNEIILDLLSQIIETTENVKIRLKKLLAIGLGKYWSELEVISKSLFFDENLNESYESKLKFYYVIREYFDLYRK